MTEVYCLGCAKPTVSDTDFCRDCYCCDNCDGLGGPCTQKTEKHLEEERANGQVYSMHVIETKRRKTKQSNEPKQQ